MPVSYVKIPYNQLLCHQEAYNLIDKAGKDRVDNWDMRAVENAVLGGENLSLICEKEKFDEIVSALEVLDSKMPFLKFKEDGQHYGYELFLSPPEYWASRGAPLFWAYAARKFTYDKLPMSIDLFREKYLSIVNEFEIPFGEDDYVYCERFAAGGMSSGMVGGMFVKDALDTLCQRLKKYS